MSPFISFVVPVYNVEKYIRNCVESIISQNLTDYEIILVNDGSTDKSGEICEELAENYKEINIIHTSNKGQSSARNTGVQFARGKYIAFLDSDDFYIKDSFHLIESILRENSNVDIVIGKVNMFYDDTNIIKSKCNYKNLKLIEGLSGEESLNYLINSDQFLQSVYSYIVKKELLLLHNISFNLNYAAYEDFDFTVRVFLNAKEVRVVDEFFLMYRKNRIGQITFEKNLKRDLSALEVLLQWTNELKSIQINEKTKSTIMTYLSNKYLYWVSNQYLYRKEERKTRYNSLKKGSWIIKYVNRRNLTPAKYIYKIFGFKVCTYFLMIMQYGYIHMNDYRNKKWPRNGVSDAD